MTINVAPYDPAWLLRFETARRTLEAQLAPWLSARVEHIGSTAVPGLSAKPIIDMIAGVHDLAGARAAIPLLEATGWRHADHRPDEALWFHRPGGSDWAARTHHLHLTEVTSRLWAERLCFRDALRADPELLREYEQLKHQAAMQTSDMAEYTRHKKTLIVSVLRQAGLDAR